MTDADLSTARMTAASLVLGAIAANVEGCSDKQLWLTQDDLFALPESIQAHVEARRQERPTTEPRFAIRAKILAAYSLGWKVPDA